MINKLIIDGVNVELTEDDVMPYTYTFSQAKEHKVRFGLDNTTEICAYAFEGCKNLTSIKFPDEITMIKRAAFKDCTGLSSITINKPIEYIGQQAFTGCNNLKEVNFESSTPPSVYCKFPDITKLFVPNDSKYGKVEYEDINKDPQSGIEYFTKTDWNEYIIVDDVTSVDEDVQYYTNLWGEIGNNSKVIEQKNRIPVSSVDMTIATVALNQGVTEEFTYILSPENETNHQLKWYSENENLVTINTDTGKAGVIEITASKTNYGSCKINAYAESGAHNTAIIYVNKPANASTTTAPASTTTAPASETPTEYTYWNVNINELSGMAFIGETLYGITDEGDLYTIELKDNHNSITTKVKSFGSSYDFEGLTTDGNKLYACVEGTQSIVEIDIATYNLTELGNVYNEFETMVLNESAKDVNKGEDPTTYDPIKNGLEGIAYYKDNIVIVGNQNKFTGVIGFNVSEKKAAGTASKVGSSKYDITEIGDMCIDGEYIYIVDSTTGLVIKTDIKLTSKGNYKIENYEKLTNKTEGVDYYNLKFVGTNPDINNVECICIKGDKLYYGCDTTASECKIYMINKF